MATLTLTQQPMGSFSLATQQKPTIAGRHLQAKQQPTRGRPRAVSEPNISWNQNQKQQPTTGRSRSLSAGEITVRGSISEKNIAVGTIVYLAPKKDGAQECKCAFDNCKRRYLAPQGYDHPAVVLRIRDDRYKGGEIMTICCTMSNNPQPIRCEAPSKFVVEGRNAAITTSDEQLILSTEKGSTIWKQSYIYHAHAYEIPISQLSCFDTFKEARPFQNRLTKESYHTLMAHINLAPGQWISTADLESGKSQAVFNAASNLKRKDAPVKKASIAKKTKPTDTKGINSFALLSDDSSSSDDDDK